MCCSAPRMAASAIKSVCLMHPMCKVTSICQTKAEADGKQDDAFSTKWDPVSPKTRHELLQLCLCTVILWNSSQVQLFIRPWQPRKTKRVFIGGFLVRARMSYQHFQVFSREILTKIWQGILTERLSSHYLAWYRRISEIQSKIHMIKTLKSWFWLNGNFKTSLHI